MVKTKQIVIGGIVAAFGVLAAACSHKDKGTTEVIAYDGSVGFDVDSVPAAVDTVFNFDGEPIDAFHINRSATMADSNYYVAINVYAMKHDSKINGYIAKYVAEAMNEFLQTDSPADDEIHSDSIGVLSAERVVGCCDSAVKEFAAVIVPQAVRDSVVATNYATDVRPVYADKDYITYSFASDSYFGGAHGEQDFYLQTFNRMNGTALGFYNLVPADKQQEVREELVSVIAASKEMNVEQYLAMVNQWVGNTGKDKWTVETFPIDHVGITSQGYVFFYPKYSIAPGSDGCPVYVVRR